MTKLADYVLTALASLLATSLVVGVIVALASNGVEQLTPEQAAKEIPEKYHKKQLAEAIPIEKPKPRFEKQWITNIRVTEGWVSQYTYIVKDNLLNKCVWVIETDSGAVSQPTECK
jgi:hypothetical protein